MSENFAFDYNEAFSRNIGWITEQEQGVLKSKRIAIAGMGGVGGSHLLTLTRLGVGNFNIADFDKFELANFNRQAGSSVPHINQEKALTMEKLAHGINPGLDIKRFDQGVTVDNLDKFLQGVDLYIDGLDFFALDIRQKVFARCYELGIPAITAAPLGMGTALITFLPGKMSFEEYFRLKGHTPMDQQIRFLIGLSPAFLHQPYLVDKSRVNFVDKKGPSTPMACELCAGATATEALKILLKRGRVQCAPWGYQFDAFRNKFKKTWRPWGNDNIIQKIAFYIACKLILGKKK
jgi:molybdopterin/thiamine biosynthesis adenylyltransferase